ncbi:hypothetical protein GCM10007939_10810 [Amylibacter marinus]|uniref:DUF177 domain-containing protein n=1 Tax=Amylibacter marinus TaxID=1475483 RepID=A0ABQ5VUN8_9RHOB|nr:YceD family protein [Amylibacter marinus]GLQ34798.1 hypothetical protein GCM10007939_10810 [Amylibacter marinus]
MSKNPKPPAAQTDSVIILAELSQNRPRRFALRLDDAQTAQIQNDLTLRRLSKVTLEGEITSEGRTDWALTASVGASVVQACVISNDDIKTRLDIGISRRYLHDFEAYDAEFTTEEELNAEIEPLPAEIDLIDLIRESISLNIDDFPRINGTSLETSLSAPKGVTPLTDEAVKPFAALASLKDKLKS